MGASGWYYVVPYQLDVGAALEQLRQDVFERGDYLRLERNPDFGLSEAEYRFKLVAEYPKSAHAFPEIDDYLEFYMGEYHDVRQQPEPFDLDSLLAWQKDCGTHSIIDIDGGVSLEPGTGRASPIEPDVLLEMCGTLTPTRDHVDRVQHRIGSGADRWQARFVISFAESGEPTNIHFAGSSGD